MAIIARVSEQNKGPALPKGTAFRQEMMWVLRDKAGPPCGNILLILVFAGSLGSDEIRAT
jgi:hypothetical protein